MRGLYTAAFVAAATLAGCNDGSGASETDGAPPAAPETTAGGTTEPTPTTDPATTSTATTGAAVEACCEPDGDGFSCSACSDPEQSCAAEREIGVLPEASDFFCQDTCVPTDTAGLWCADDASCCDPDATCQSDGVCRGPADDTDSGGDDTDTDGTSSSSSSSSSSGGSDSSSSSGSSSSSSSTGDMMD